jgi:serine/threonine-protein kinase
MNPDIVPDSGMQQRFEQEAKLGAKIRSAHVVEVVAAGVDDATGLRYLVMELLEGEDLHVHLQRNGPLPFVEVCRIFEQLCHAVGAAHAAGIVHRDLKLENIFLAKANQVGTQVSMVKVLDFGIAKLASEARTHATAAIGSPLWMAPEQTAPGPVTPAADVWALGLIAYALLTGEHFWRSARPGATPAHLLREIVLSPIPPASAQGGARIPTGFDAWFARCVVREATARFPTATEAWAAMQQFSGRRDYVSPSGRPASFAPEALAATSSAEEFFIGTAPTQETPLVASTDSPRAASVPAPARVAKGESVALWKLGPVLVVAAGLLAYRWLPSTPSVPKAPEVVAAVPPQETVPPIPSDIPKTSPPPPPMPTPSVREKPAAEPTQEVATPALPLRDGFGDPNDGTREERGGRLWKVQERHVRLFTRLVSNGSNVADSVVRGAVDWSSWHFLQCYEHVFGAAKDMPGGTVTVSFDILDQLPQHAALGGSTFSSVPMDRCVVSTLQGQTINAAGATGKGHVVYAFKFVVVD